MATTSTTRSEKPPRFSACRSATRRSRSLPSSRRSPSSFSRRPPRAPRPLADEVQRLPPRRDVGDQILPPLALVLRDRRRGGERAQEPDLPVVAGAAVVHLDQPIVHRVQRVEQLGGLGDRQPLALDRRRLDAQHAAAGRRDADGVQEDRARQAGKTHQLDARLPRRAPAPPDARAIAEHGHLRDPRLDQGRALGRPGRHHDARHLVGARRPGDGQRGDDEREGMPAGAQFVAGCGVRISVTVRRPA